jgi:hypothetical protein
MIIIGVDLCSETRRNQRMAHPDLNMARRSLRDGLPSFSWVRSSSQLS